jgi:hypothetical protein
MALLPFYRAGYLVVEGDLLTNVTANTDGVWSRLDASPWTVSVETTSFSGTIKLHVSNSVSKPADNEAGTVLNADLVNTEPQQHLGRFTWVKASVTGYSAGTVDRVSVYARVKER